MKQFGFSKQERIRTTKDFKRVFNKKQKCISKYFNLYWANNDNTHLTRIGIVISKKIGKAYVRNKIKRLIRETYRLNKRSIKKSCDIIFLCKPEIKQLNNYYLMKEQIFYVLDNANLLISKTKECK